MQRMICIPSNQYSQMLESYDNAMNRNGQFKKAYIEIKERPA